MSRFHVGIWFLLLLAACGGEAPATPAPDATVSIPTIREGDLCANEDVSTTVPCFSTSQRCPGGGAREGHLLCQRRWICVFDSDTGCESTSQDGGTVEAAMGSDVSTDVVLVDTAPPGEVGLVVEINKTEREITTVQGSVFDGHALILSSLGTTSKRVAGINLHARGFTGSGYRAADAARVVQHCHLEREGAAEKIALTPDIAPDVGGVFRFRLQGQGLNVPTGAGVRIQPVCQAIERVSSPDGYRIAFGLVGPEDVEVTDGGQRVQARVASAVRNQVEGDPTAFVTVWPSGRLDIAHQFTADISTGGNVLVYPTEYRFAAERETVSIPLIPISWQGSTACIRDIGIFTQGRVVMATGIHLSKGNTVTLSTSLSFTPGTSIPVRIGVRFHPPAVGSRCAPGQRVSFSIGATAGGEAYDVQAEGVGSRARIIPTGNPRAANGSILRGGTVTIN